MKKYCLLLIIMMLSLNVKAITLEKCTTEKMNRLKEIADKIEFNYTFNKNSKNGYGYFDFTINATNLNKEIKALIIQDFYSMNYKEFKNDGKGNGSIKGFLEGENVSITLKAFTADECSTKTVTVKQVKLPYYNQFYDEEFCLTNPNFKYCSELTPSKVTKDMYDREMKKYIEENSNTKTNEDKNNNNIWLFVGIGAGVVLIGSVVAFILIRRKKNEL